jgi:hypothetical protein
MPTSENVRWVEEGEPPVLTAAHQASLEAFIGNCRLVGVVDR